MRRKVEHRFKVGELVEQIDYISGNEVPLCRIISFQEEGDEDMVQHIHIGESNVKTAPIDSFRKIPKLRRLLKYGV